MNECLFVLMIAVFKFLTLVGLRLKVHPIFFNTLKGIHSQFRGLSGKKNATILKTVLYNDI